MDRETAKIDDRVRITGIDNNRFGPNNFGTIVNIPSNKACAFVEFDKDFDGGHSLLGTIKSRRGWCARWKNLEKITLYEVKWLNINGYYTNTDIYKRPITNMAEFIKMYNTINKKDDFELLLLVKL